MPRLYNTTYHPDDPPIAAECKRGEYSLGCAALHDAMWDVAHRTGSRFRLSAQDMMRLLQDRPSPAEIRGRA
jgi:hypothetical protein